MSSRSKRKKKLRALTHKVEYLRLEVEDRDEVLKEYEQAFMKELLQFTDGSEDVAQAPVPEQKAQIVDQIDGPGIEEKLVESKEVKDLPEEIKKIWKSIALLTHPDRTKNDPEKTALYVAANRAAENGSVDEILRIATELNIEIPEDSSIVEEKLESIASELESKLKDTEGSVLWQWGNADPAVKKNIMDMYIKMKRFKKKDV